MKIATLFSMLLVFTSLVAQNHKALIRANGVSMDEYRYCTLGYLDDIKKGKDPTKEGLTFKKVHSFNDEYGYKTIKISIIEVSRVSTKQMVGFIIDVGEKSAYLIASGYEDEEVAKAGYYSLKAVDSYTSKHIAAAIQFIAFTYLDKAP